MSNRCRPTLLAITIIAVLVGIPAGAAAIEWRKIGASQGFFGLHDELQNIADRLGHDRIAVFCVVLRDSGDHDPLAYALWPQRQLLYRWQATRDAAISDATLLHHAPLDLRRDIVRTAADRLSSYRVTRAWVHNVELQCRDHGEQVRIMRGGR